MTDSASILPDYRAPFYGFRALIAKPELVTNVARVDPPAVDVEYEATLLAFTDDAHDRQLLRWFRESTVPEGGRRRYWAQKRPSL